MNSKFEELRNKYPNFIYNNYLVDITDNDLTITYDFEIEGLTKFNPKIIVPLKNGVIVNEFLENIIFNIGLVELVSYAKLTCSPNIIIKCGYLNDEQISFFKKLYYEGLGEFRYLNNIDISIDDMFNFIIEKEKKDIKIPEYFGLGNLIPIGGGKDSCVTLELLSNYKHINDAFIINPKKVTLECAKLGLNKDDKIIGITRILDKKMIELNNEGYLNGHTPFSAIVAFTSYLVAYLNNKKYIVLSNEASANEVTVLGTDINHQYSKTYEFESDFNNYIKNNFKIDITYFSLLRCISEFQIGMLFSNYKKYHQVFKSCNVGSKGEEWHWCGTCPKCLFVYIILSPFLSKEELINIFGSDLYEKEELLDTFIELLGYSKTKPFECVGTYSEVRYAVSLVINKSNNLPYLLNYYKEHYELELNTNYKELFNEENNIPEEYLSIIKKEVEKYAK